MLKSTRRQSASSAVLSAHNTCSTLSSRSTSADSGVRKLKITASTATQVRRHLIQRRRFVRSLTVGCKMLDSEVERGQGRRQTIGPITYNESILIEKRKTKALAKFKKIVRFVIVFMKWIMAMREEAEKTGGGGSEAITGLTQNFDSAMVTADGQTFDVSDYQSKKEVLLSQDVRNVLGQHPTHRTREMIEVAKYGLQHVKSYSEYPLHMQEKLATVAYFQEVDAKRVIIREGHTAENFYFILSGSATVSKLFVDEKTGQSKMMIESILKKGDSFGEMELLHHSERACTVVSQVPMTLLTVGRNEFFEIFMESQGNNDLPDHIRFISTLDVMKGYPIERLVGNPEKCLLHFFRRGDLIVKDSVQSEWLYFIKTGTCQVIKSLKTSNPKNKAKSSDKKWRGPTDFSRSLPHLGTAAQPSRIDSRFKSQLPPKPKTPKQRRLERSTTPNNMMQEDFLAKDDDNLPLLVMEAKLEADAEFREEHEFRLSQMDIPMEPTTPHRNATRNNHLSVGYTKSKFKLAPGRALLPPMSPPYYAREEHDMKRKVHFSVKEASAAAETLTATPEASAAAPEASAVGVGEEQKASSSNHLAAPIQPKPALTLSASSKGSSLMKKLVSHLAKKDPPPVFVQVDLLKPRDIFGLANIRFDEFHESNDLSVSLVSRGAECIMIQKQFFIDHSPTKVRHAMMTLVRTYPETDTLQGNLETKDNWESYRRSILNKTQDNMIETKQFRRSLSLNN